MQQILVLLLVLPLKLQLASQQVWIQRLWLAVSEARLRGKLKKQTRRPRRRARSCPETRNSQKVRNLPYTKTSRAIVFFGTPLISWWKTSLSSLREIHCRLSHVNFEAFPRLHQAKGPNRERQVLSSDKERVEQPPSLFTTDQSYAQNSANLQHYILLRDKLVMHAVIRATTVSTCNATMLRDKLKANVARFTGPLA